MLVLTPFTLALSLTVWFSAFLMKVGPHWLIDLPAERKIHDRPVPRTGGIAIGAVYFLGILILDLGPSLWWYLAGGTAIYALGALDDYKHISWQIKLMVQLVVASLIIYRFLGEVSSISFFSSNLNFSTVGLIAIFLIWFVGILNAVNLIDGMDGLAGGFMVLTTVFAVIIGILNDAGSFAVMNATLLGTLCGFLLFNQKPAKFFMGDSGSLLLGYHVACLPLLFHQSVDGGSVLTITPFLILASFLIMDTTRVFFSRLLKRQNPMTADTIHLHHLMFRETNSYMGTLIPIFVLAWVTGIGATLYFQYGFGFLAMQLFLLVLVLFVLIPPAPFYVPFTSRVISYATKLKTSRFNSKYLFRIRFLPILAATYLIFLGARTSIPEVITDSSPLFIVGVALIALSILLPIFNRRFYEGLPFLAVLILLLFLSGHDLANSTTQWIDFLCYGCLLAMVIIVLANYVENTRNLGMEFWTVIDLMVFLVFLGGVILKLNDIDIPLGSWAEAMTVYYSLGLYVQNRLRHEGVLAAG